MTLTRRSIHRRTLRPPSVAVAPIPRDKERHVVEGDPRPPRKPRAWAVVTDWNARNVTGPAPRVFRANPEPQGSRGPVSMAAEGSAARRARISCERAE